MHIELFDRDRLFESAALFGPEFEDRNRFAYHGTSGAYSSQIEAYGWTYPFHAIDPAELRALAEALPATAIETAAALRRHAASPTRLGFAAYSFAAVSFAMRGGGQVVSLCHNAIEQGAQPSNALQALLDQLIGANGVVYAVEFSNDELVDLTFEGTLFRCTADVNASQIKAKVEIPITLETGKLANIKHGPEFHRPRLEPGGLAQRVYACN
jgi:hypothetical protein